MSLLTFAYEGASLALFLSCFCRLVKTNAETLAVIRLSFWLLGVAAMVSLVAPYFGWGKPQWPTVFLLLAVVALQWFTARYWRHTSPPTHFQKASHEDHR
jgi:membrane protein implicated in regulation of membrane protease activity